MNERIEKLGIEADIFGAVDINGYYDNEDKVKKFAELIIRECAGLFEIEWGEEKLTGNDVGYVVKKHFGVEE